MLACHFLAALRLKWWLRVTQLLFRSVSWDILLRRCAPRWLILPWSATLWALPIITIILTFHCFSALTQSTGIDWLYLRLPALCTTRNIPSGRRPTRNTRSYTLLFPRSLTCSILQATPPTTSSCHNPCTYSPIFIPWKTTRRCFFVIAWHLGYSVNLPV